MTKTVPMMQENLYKLIEQRTKVWKDIKVLQKERTRLNNAISQQRFRISNK